MYVYFVYVCMYYRGSTQYRLAFCVTPVMYMWLKLIIINHYVLRIIIINQVLRIIKIVIKTDVKNGRI